MNLPHSWRDAWECARDTAVLAVIIAAMIWLLLFVLPASVGADGPRWDGDRACRPLPQCAAMAPGWPSGPMAYPYLPSTQLVPILPSQSLILPAVPSAVILVTGTQPQGTMIWVTSSMPSATPVVTPPAPPPPPPTPAPTVAPAPTVQAPQYQAPAIQPLNCSSLGCAMGDTPSVNDDLNAAPVPAASMVTRPDVGTNWAATIASIAPDPYAACLEAINAREDPDGGLHEPNHQGSGATGLYQFMPSTWAGTPIGQQVSLYDASAEQQTQAAIEEIQAGSKSAWAPVPSACAGVRVRPLAS